MAQRISVALVCDFCSAEVAAGGRSDDVAAVETFEIGITGPAYTVDLCAMHAKAVQDLRALVQNVGRTERRGVRREKPRPVKSNTRDARRARTQQLQRVRAWSREQGNKIGNARIPYAVQRAYNNAHPDDVIPLADAGRGTRDGGG